MQIQFVGEFAIGMIDVIRMFEVAIVRGVPFVIVNAVEDAGERRLSLAQQTFETETQFWRRDFSRISRAHRSDGVRVSDARLQRIHLTVEFDAVRGEIVPRQIRQRVAIRRDNSLVSEIVKRDARPRRRSCGRLLRLMMNKKHGRRRLPIMDVDQLRFPIQVKSQVRSGLRKINKPFGVIRKINAVNLV